MMSTPLSLYALVLSLSAASAQGVTSPFRRTDASRLLSLSSLAHNTNCSHSSRGCSGQVHLALGGPREMVVTFATWNDETPSEVRWWGADTPDTRLATGTSEARAAILEPREKAATAEALSL
jgi:hypothetical protein